jgi:hypothetical protein
VICCGYRPQLLLHERHEGIPVSVHLDATELEERSGPLLDPAHATVVQPLPDDVLDGALHSTRGDLQILSPKPTVVHAIDAVKEVVPDVLQLFPSSLRPRARDLIDCLSDLTHYLDGPSPINEPLHPLDPAQQFRAPFPVETASSFPELLDDVDDVDGEDRPGEELLTQPLQVIVPVAHDLDLLTGAHRKAPFVRLPPSDDKRVALGGVRPVNLLVHRSQEDALSILVDPLLQGVHDHQGCCLAILRLVPLLPPDPSVAVGVALPSNWMMRTSPSPSGGGAFSNHSSVNFPRPRTDFSTVILEGAQAKKSKSSAATWS